VTIKNIDDKMVIKKFLKRYLRIHIHVICHFVEN